MHIPKRILISRTDNIGDVILTLPMAGFIKKHFPGCEVIFLGKGYTRPIIESCTFVDKFLDWDNLSSLPRKEAVDRIKAENIDCIVHVFPNYTIASLAKQAGIPLRIGTSRRLYHLHTCNKRLNLSRKKSDLHEAQLNIELLSPLIQNTTISLEEIADYYGMSKIPGINPAYQALIDANKFNLIIHPFSKGSAREWGLENYISLIKILPTERFNIFFTGTESEGEKFRNQLSTYSFPNVVDLSGKFSLAELLAFISRTDGLLACSTGPLHMAAALGKYAIGIYPPMRPIHPGRWAPIGKHAKVFVLDKECNDCKKSASCNCILQITPLQIAEYLISLHNL